MMVACQPLLAQTILALVSYFFKEHSKEGSNVNLAKVIYNFIAGLKNQAHSFMSLSYNPLQTLVKVFPVVLRDGVLLRKTAVHPVNVILFVHARTEKRVKYAELTVTLTVMFAGFSRKNVKKIHL